MTRLDAYIFFDGNCAEAMSFYEGALRGKIENLMKAGDSPDAASLPPGAADRVMHAHLIFDNGNLMASDWMAPEPFEGRHGFSLSLTANRDEAQRLFDELSAGGQVTLPFGKTFWSDGFGMLVDRFGTAWMVSVERAAA
jgi:PhnB protein